MMKALITTETRRTRSLRAVFLRVLRVSVVNLVLFILTAPHTASACAVCFGASDSPWGKALNWGILALLFFVAIVLGGIVAFFMHMAKRARMLAQLTVQEKLQP